MTTLLHQAGGRSTAGENLILTRFAFFRELFHLETVWRQIELTPIGVADFSRGLSAVSADT
jgi:hypothetical protein